MSGLREKKKKESEEKIKKVAKEIFLSKSYSETTTEELAEKAEIGVILGPSGSGKSTLLNIIGGIDHIDSGNIIVDGVDIAIILDLSIS